MSTHYARFPDGEEIAAACILPLTTEDWKRIQANMRRHVSGVFSSRKMNAPLPWRKPLERALLCLLEVDPWVDSIETMPHQVVLVVEGKERRYTPAIQIRSGGRTAVMDAVSDSRAADPARIELTSVLKSVYRAHGFDYSAVPQREILLEPRFGNARSILRCRGFTPDIETERRVVEVLSTARSSTIAGIQERLAPRPYVPETVCAMMLAGRVTLDLSAARPSEMRVALRTRDGA
jgi:hypothetical protein